MTIIMNWHSRRWQMRKQMRTPVFDTPECYKRLRVRYVRGGTRPRSIPSGRVLMHNRVFHGRTSRCGDAGFRCWTADARFADFEECPPERACEHWRDDPEGCLRRAQETLPWAKLLPGTPRLMDRQGR